MELLILVDVVSVNDIGMVEGGDRPRLAVEALACRLVLGLGARQHLDGHPAPHELMLAQKDLPHPARTDPFEDLVFADRKAAPAALEDVLSLKIGQQTVPDKHTGQLGWFARSLTRAAQLLQI